MSNKDMISDVKSVKSAKSNNSVKSKQSDNNELTLEQFKTFKRM